MPAYPAENGTTTEHSSHERVTSMVVAYQEGLAAGWENRELFLAIWKECEPDIRSMARRLIGHYSMDVDDIVQSVALQLLRRIGTFQGRSQFRTWLYRVTMNVVLQDKRFREREHDLVTEQVTDEIVDDTTCPDAERQRDEEEVYRIRHAVLHDVLCTMDRRYSEPLILSEFDDRSNAEICAVMGLKLAAVKSRLHRARAILRTLLLERLPRDL